MPARGVAAPDLPAGATIRLPARTDCRNVSQRRHPTRGAGVAFAGGVPAGGRLRAWEGYSGEPEVRPSGVIVYPSPCTVWTKRGRPGSGSIFFLSLAMAWSTDLVAGVSG